MTIKRYWNSLLGQYRELPETEETEMTNQHERLRLWREKYPRDSYYLDDIDAFLAEYDAALERIRELEQEVAAIRELMNIYNLGGWTDSIAPMKRALAAEARILELEKNRP